MVVKKKKKFKKNNYLKNKVKWRALSKEKKSWAGERELVNLVWRLALWGKTMDF